MADLDQALADAREYVNALTVTGNDTAAKAVESIVERIAEATEDVRRWLCESDAVLASGLASRTLRRRFSEWMVTGHARYNARNEREYRLDIVRRKPGEAKAIRARVRQRLGRVA